MDENGEKESLSIINEYVKKYKIKSKTINKNGIELTIEIRIHDTESEFINKISNLESVKNVVLVSYNGDYMS